ncbi:MAG TPA: SufD family Fe-S cluster assembly protein [Candidatus Limnocylindrales bacterium]
MTAPVTQGTPDSAPNASPTDRRRPARRGPADLPFTFPDVALAATLTAERGEPTWLGAERLAAANGYAALPLETNHLYRTYVDLRAAELFKVRPYVATASTPADAAPARPPDGVSAVIELREDEVAVLAITAEAAAAGVTLETFGAALARDPRGLRADLEGGIALPADDKLAQLSRGFWSQGVRLVVPDGVRLAHPVIVRWAAGVPERALVTRTIVRLGVGAEASLVEELLPSGPPIECAAGELVPQSLFTGTLEVTLGARARLAVASIQDLPAGVMVVQHRNAVIGEGADLHWALAQLGGRIVRSRVDNRLDGDRGAVEQVEIVFGSEDQVVDLTSYTRHRGRDTTGNLLSKAVLMDRSRTYMKGLITIDKPAVGTDSYLGEFGMNLSRQARAVAIPSLEIDQPDCRRAAHSSSVGPIDETQLFYLESRGIPPDEARKFIVLGFLEPVVARVPLADAQDRLRGLLEDKWAASSPGSASGAGSASAA